MGSSVAMSLRHIVTILCLTVSAAQSQGPSRVTGVSVTKSVEDGNYILNVSWSTPQSELPITEYEVEYRKSGTESWINSTRLSVSPPANSTLLTGLDPGVEYIIRVRALSETGTGAWSEEHRVRTDEIPPKVTGVSVSKAVKDGNPSLRVTWTALQNVTNLSEYRVEYRRNGELNWANVVSVQPYSTSTLLPALLPGTEYNVRMRAMSTAGEGEWSEVLTETTFDSPSRVTGVSVTKSVEDGNYILNVSWTTPQSELPSAEYEVEYRTSGTGSWINSIRLSVSPPANSTILTGLDAGVEYIVRVRAVSEIGAGAWSEERRVRTDDIPPKVTGVSVSKAVKDGKPSLRVTWTALQNVANLLEYRVEYRRNGELNWDHRVNRRPYSTSTLLPDLLPGTEYNVRVRAVSAAGEGEWSDVHTETTFNKPKDVDTNVSVTRSVEDGKVTLNVSWTTPQSELPITEYEVEYRTHDTESWINSTRLSVSPPANSTLLTGLDAGVEYVVRVRAVSEIGAGAWSEEQTIAAPSDNNCLGPGFTLTIPAREEWSQYSTTVLKPGDAAVYSSLSFACNGTLQSLAFPYAVLGSNYRYWNEYLYILVSVWRFNETGYYQVREFQDSVRVPGQAFREHRSTTSIFPQMEVLAKDTLAFRLLRPYNSDLGPVYRHVRFLFKPGPSPGAFIPIVSASFTASSGPVTDDADSTQSPANGTENNILQNEGVIFGIFLAVCQVEVVLVAIATGLIVHFITKVRIKRNLTLSHDRSGKTAERSPERSDNRPLYESVSLGGSTGEHVEMQPSPAYQATSKPEYLQK